MTTIKITDGKDIRRFSTDTVTFDGIHARAKELFGMDDNFSLQYRDDEGDMIMMSSQEEMVEALALLSEQPPPAVLRLTVKKNKKNPKTAPAPKHSPTANSDGAEKEATEKEAVEDDDLPPPLARLLGEMARTAPHLLPGIKAALKQQPWLVPLVTQFAAEQPHMVHFGTEMLRNLCASSGRGPENLAAMAAAFAPCGFVPPGCGFAPPPAAATDTATAAEDDEGEAVHHGVRCDRSGVCPIVGKRWHLNGHDWDLCDAEYQKLADNEKSQFSLVPPPAHRYGFGKGKGKGGGGKATLGGCMGKGFGKGFGKGKGMGVGGHCHEVHIGVTCDRSGMSPIIGPRWHLPGKNYDLCQDEYEKLDDKEKAAFERVPVPIKAEHFGREHGGHCGKGEGREHDGHGGHGGHWGKGGGGGKLAARFVSDVAVFDGTQMAPGTAFTKIWKIKNSGEVPWPPGTQLCFVGGDQMSANLTVPLSHQGPVMPGEEVDCSVDLIAPREHGRYVGYFRLTGPRERRRWGQRIWAHVHVVDPANQLLPTELDFAAEIEKAEEIKAAAASEDEADGDDSAADDEAMKPPPEPAAKPVAASVAPSVEVEAPAPAEAEPRAPSPTLSVSSFINVDAADVAAADGKVVAPPMVAEPEALPPAAAAPVDDAPTDDALTATGFSLAAMGFTDEALVAHVLEKNGADVDACARDLVALGEWEEALSDLVEMGFNNILLNQKLLLKNGGELKKTVKELVRVE